ncbi:hypothetical protein [Gallionella capsiferriformans]|uniref:Uncharacterized protein n=1 Tax=Gallionella capsiferriformans (strain ES-2) TaxID=395494 RepID=D9SG30_GALCS|nr:hypothetical protein [Gallionella capsiferriformans]ADL55477.1 hypothetical protein Galf_1458 [Gallionella capsiferriformans ES-2]
MKYTFQKIFIVLFCSVFVMIGAPSLINAIQGGGNLFGLVWGGMFVFIPLSIAIFWLRQLSRFQKMTYVWYKTVYADNVQGNKVSCFVCGNDSIHVRALMNKTFHREHFCTQCGKTLYYSPEQG